MKTEDSSKINNDNCPFENSEKLMGRRELLNKAGWYALSATTMMVLLKSQPAKSASLQGMPQKPNQDAAATEWRRTTRS